MGKKEDVHLGRFISLILRHQPSVAGVTLDEHGWADVDNLIKGMNSVGQEIDMETLERIVRENDKQRYSFNENHTKIRANQGHSIKTLDLQFKQQLPPDTLFHGTAERFLNSIQVDGIQKCSRQYVHLSKDYETAIKVGKRHGKPVVLEIDCKSMINDGFIFYLAENGVWLTDNVPYKYIIKTDERKEVENNEDNS